MKASLGVVDSDYCVYCDLLQWLCLGSRRCAILSQTSYSLDTCRASLKSSSASKRSVHLSMLYPFAQACVDYDYLNSGK